MLKGSPQSPLAIHREVKFGEMQSEDLVYAGNTVSIRKYTRKRLLSHCISAVLHNYGYMWLLFVVGVDCALYMTANQDDLSTVIVVFLGLCLRFLMEMNQEKGRFRIENRINSGKYKVWDGCEFRDIQSSRIQCGDLVLVPNGNKVAADSVLFASERPDGSCYIDHSFTLNQSEMTTKLAVTEIHRYSDNGSLDKFTSNIDQITGVMKVTTPNQYWDDFSGQIRLNKWPAAVSLTTANFLLAGSRVYGAKWIISCVVAAGMDTKAMFHTQQKHHFHSKLHEIIDKYALIAIAITGICVLGDILAYLISENEDETAHLVIWWSISRYFRLLPALLYLLIDLITVLQAVLTVKNSRFKGKIELNKASLLANFGQIDYVVVDKNSVLTSNRPHVQTLICHENVYDHCPGFYTGSHSCLSIRRRSKFLNPLDQCFLFTNSTEAPSKDLFLRVNPPQETGTPCGFRMLQNQLAMESNRDVVEMMKCMVLCTTVTQVEPVKGRNLVEDALIQCGKLMNCMILEREEEKIVLQIADYRVNLRLLYSQYSPKSSEEMMVIYDETDSEPGKVYIRGSIESLCEHMNISEELKERIRGNAVEMKRIGLIPTILAGKDLEREVLRELKDRIRFANVAVISGPEKLEAVYREMKRELRYLGVVCVEDTLGTGCSEGVERLTQAGVRVWVVSSEGETETMNSWSSVGLSKEEDYTVPVLKLRDRKACEKMMADLVSEFIIRQQPTHEDSPRVPKTSPQSFPLDALLSDLQLSFSSLDLSRKLLSLPFSPSSVHFNLIIDGTSFDTALLFDSTQSLLSALLFLSTSVCFCDMLPHQKAKVVSFLKNSFAFKPVVLCVGDGVSVGPMMSEADLTVAVKRENSDRGVHLVDGKVVSLSVLADFLLLFGRRWSRGLFTLIRLLIYENTLFLCLQLAYSGLCLFTVSPLPDLQLTWIVTYLCTKPPLFYLALFNTDLPMDSLNHYPELYRWRNPPFSLLTISKTLLIAVFHAVIVFFTAIIDLKSAISPYGYTENMEVLDVLMTISAFLTILMHILNQYERLSGFFLLSIAFSVVIFLTSLIIINFTDENMGNCLQMTINFPIFLIKILFPPLFCFAISYFSSIYRTIFSFSIGSFLINSDFCLQRAEKYSKNLYSLWKPAKNWKPKGENDLFARKLLLNSFKWPKIEKKYRNFAISEVIARVKTCYILLAIAVLVSVIVSEASKSSVSSDYLALKVVLSLFCVFLCLLSHSHFFLRHYISLTYLSTVILIVSLGAYEAVTGNISTDIFISIPIFTFLHLPMTYFYALLLTLFHSVLYFSIAWYYLLTTHPLSEALFNLFNFSIAALAVTVTIALVGKFLDDMCRNKFQLLTLQEIELDKGANVLKHLLPKFVLSRVKDGVRFIAEFQPCVHILFCDISGFDGMIKDYSPTEITSLLNKIYLKMDDICERCGVTKIETVGKTYVACTGIKESEMDLKEELKNWTPVQRVIYCAFEFLEAIELFILPDGKKIHIKIGINSGQVVAGVVGHHKPQFSLVGDSINTASRMCSTLNTENAIQLSSSTYALIQSLPGLSFHCQQLEIKGKGSMSVYLLTKTTDEFLLTPTIYPQNNLQFSRRASKPALNIELNALKTFIDRKPPTKWFSLRHLARKNTEIYRNTLKFKQKISVKGLIVVSFMEILSFLVECVEVPVENENNFNLLLQGLSALLLFSLLLLSVLYFTRVKFAHVSLIFLVIVLILHFLSLFLQNPEDTDHQGFSYIILILITLVHFTGIRTIYYFPVLISLFISTLTVYFVLNIGQKEPLRLICTLSEIGLYGFYLFYRDLMLQNYLELKENVRKEIEKTEDLLKNLLPVHIVDSLRSEAVVSDHMEHTTLLVADIVGFTSFSTTKEPVEVIEVLSSMFSQFDKLCIRHHLYKVYTIGDCYIALGFDGHIDQRDPGQECLHIVEMALDMIKTIATINEDYFTSLNMRIGIHTGNIIGAIIGTNIVRYDIYGQDVTVAFKMEANSAPGRINLSEPARLLLEHAAPGAYQFTENTVVRIPSMDIEMPCHFLTPN